MTPAESLWLSGLFLGIALGLPLGVVFDRFIIRPSVHALLAHRRPNDWRS